MDLATEIAIILWLKPDQHHNTHASSESHQSTIADKAPEGILFSPPPNVSDLEFNDVSSSLPLLLSALVSINKSKKPSTATASDEKKLELIWAA